MDDFIKELPGYIAQVLTFGLMIGFLILISTIVLGVFMYIITIQKKQTFGIMKVQGISNKYIANSVITQTFLVSLIGVLMGLGLTLISELLLPQTVPFKSNYIFYLIIAVLIVVISMLGAIFSVRGVTKVDPLEVLE
ncbi:ABC transporter permease [Helcococcus kunzii]|nr:ABC transporter permease [Helcococcus kunzii]MCT1796524.1 ABC transporter permease [Helcococcus kunzii]MCT1988336.1 ABC transporter permease [Helcococcus kunzii]